MGQKGTEFFSEARSRWLRSLSSISKDDDGYPISERRALSDLGRFWVGDDYYYNGERRAILFPGHSTTIPIEIPLSGLPPFESYEEISPNGLFWTVRISLRSRLAQSGLFASEITPLSQEFTFESGTLQPYRAALSLSVFGGRSIEINPGDRLGRLFSRYGANLLEGKDLYQATHDGEVQIQGVEGKDWELITKPYPTVFESGDEICRILLKLDPSKFRFIPRNLLHLSPIAILDPRLSDYRKFLDQEVLKPVPQKGFSGNQFFIGETVSSVSLLPGFNAILEPLSCGYFQTTSRLLKAEETNHRIRTEYYGGLPPDRELSVTMALFKDRN